MNGEHGFNEVFFTDAHVDRDRLVGEVGGGWSVAVTMLMYERFMTAAAVGRPGSRRPASSTSRRARRPPRRGRGSAPRAGPASASW